LDAGKPYIFVHTTCGELLHLIQQMEFQMKKHLVDMSNELFEAERENEHKYQKGNKKASKLDRGKLRMIKEMGGIQITADSIQVERLDVNGLTVQATQPVFKEKYLVMVDFTHYFDITSERVHLKNKELGWLPDRYWYKFLIRGNHTLLAVTKEGEPAARWTLDEKGNISPAPRRKVDGSGKTIPEKYNLKRLYMDLFDIPIQTFQSLN